MDTSDRLPFEFLHALDELERNGLPKEMIKFNMGQFCDFKTLDSDITCGTVGRFVGLLSYFIEKETTETWVNYSKRISVFTCTLSQWDWVFGSYWVKTDNSMEGAIARARYYNEHGLPENWNEQIHGTAPLCYKVEDKIKIAV